MTVASLNLHCGFGSLGEPFDVTSAICQLDAAVVCVQEYWVAADSRDQVAEAAAKLGGELRRAPMCTRPSVAALGVPAISGPGELGIAVLTTVPVTGYAEIALGRAPADNVPRVAQVVTLSLPGGGALRVVNTHLTYALTSPLQLLRLRGQLARRESRRRPAPTVVAGDLNMPLLAAGLASGCAPAVRGRTYPAAQPVIQLDHILVSGGIKPAGGTVLAAAGSDHLPVRARLQVAP